MQPGGVTTFHPSIPLIPKCFGYWGGRQKNGNGRLVLTEKVQYSSGLTLFAHIVVFLPNFQSKYSIQIKSLQRKKQNHT